MACGDACKSCKELQEIQKFYLTRYAQDHEGSYRDADFMEVMKGLKERHCEKRRSATVPRNRRMGI